MPLRESSKPFPTAITDLYGKSDTDCLDAIRADRLDILFELCGHFGGNRQLVFAKRAAPIQIMARLSH